MSGVDIFLSYARHDRATARLVAECLVDEGFTVWWDASLHSGETFDEVIERNLREAKAVVVLWSPRSVASRWVRAEATIADRRDKLAPAIIEPCDLPIIFELKHATDLSHWTGDMSDAQWQRFVQDLQRLVDANGQGHAGAQGQPQKAGAAAPAQPPSRQPLRPGNNEVIFAKRARPGSAATPPPERQSIARDPASGEIHCLEIEGDELRENPIIIHSSGVKIGRVAPADVVLSHKSISREHCIIGLANDELLVSDLNSTNGTYIDDVRISRATILPVGSVLRLGEISLRHAIRTSEDEGRSGATKPGGFQAGRFAAA